MYVHLSVYFEGVREHCIGGYDQDQVYPEGRGLELGSGLGLGLGLETGKEKGLGSGSWPGSELVLVGRVGWWWK